MTPFLKQRNHGKSIILLTYMSNPGAEAFYSLMATQANGTAKPVFEILTNLAVEWKAHGVIVGATKPEIIKRVRTLAGPNLSIYSPGVGAQGGDARKAIAAGCTYLIVGRSIYNAPDHVEAAKSIRQTTGSD